MLFIHVIIMIFVQVSLVAVHQQKALRLLATLLYDLVRASVFQIVVPPVDRTQSILGASSLKYRFLILSLLAQTIVDSGVTIDAVRVALDSIPQVVRRSQVLDLEF